MTKRDAEWAVFAALWEQAVTKALERFARHGPLPGQEAVAEAARVELAVDLGVPLLGVEPSASREILERAYSGELVARLAVRALAAATEAPGGPAAGTGGEA